MKKSRREKRNGFVRDEQETLPLDSCKIYSWREIPGDCLESFCRKIDWRYIFLDVDVSIGMVG